MKKALWIDVDNSPHVSLFAPIIKYYRESGVEVILTARSHSQTIELLNAAGFSKTFSVIGGHYGKSKIHKIGGLIIRAKQLISHIKKVQKGETEIKVAVSHGSRAMVLAAKFLKIPIITMYDYEFTETVIFNRFSDKVLVPEKIPGKTLDEIKLPIHKRVKYQGLKEQLYLNYYKKNPNFWSDFKAEFKLNTTESTILIALRPPATTANYHNNNGDILFKNVLIHLLGDKNTLTIVSPRTESQRIEIEALIKELNLDLSRCLLLEKTVNGLDLANSVDLLISGGGTMNREAVLLGTSVYSIFAGRQGALDLAMEKDGLIKFIREPEDVKKIKLEKTEKNPLNILTGNIEQCAKDQINRWVEN